MCEDISNYIIDLAPVAGRHDVLLPKAKAEVLVEYPDWPVKLDIYRQEAVSQIRAICNMPNFFFCKS